jgi:hypothetical protein
VADAMFVIRTFSDELSAGIAQSVLEANGVESTLIRDDAAGALPFLNTLHPVRLAVREADVELALELLDPDDDGPGAA